MTDPESLQNQFTTDLGELLLAVQTARAVPREAFDRVERQSRELARVLKGHALIRKSLLNEMRVAIKILRAEAAAAGGQAALTAMADKLEMTFDLILKNESHEDRIPGVPRVI
jgi:hypothetical protein